MKTIEIDNEIYSHLLENVTNFGESPNTVLRKLLLNNASVTTSSKKELEINSVLDSREFKYARGVVGKFLTVLSWLYNQNPSKFSAVEDIHGRGRIYFSKSKDELLNSGRSVNPKKIEGTPYWVITTTPTDLKQNILDRVMTELKYDRQSIQIATKAIA